MKDLDPGKVERLLVRSTNWIGDAVMSVPALREIRRVFPRANISLLCRPWVKDVYSAVDFIDEILEYDKSQTHKGWGGVRILASGLRRRKFEVAILLQNAAEAALIAWMARIPVRIGYARDGRSLLLSHACRIEPGVRRAHQVFYYLGILSAIGLVGKQLWKQADFRPSIAIGVRDTDRDSAKQLLLANGMVPGDIIIGVNPGAAYGGAKRWLSERYAAVADRLTENTGARIVLLGSSGEKCVAEEVAAKMRHTPLVMAGRTTLGQLMGMLREFSLLITNDSGPMHLAAALGTPQLAIFGSTSETATGPLHDQSEVIKEEVECNPCFLRECPIDFRCMTRISVERVLTAAEKKLENCRRFEG